MKILNNLNFLMVQKMKFAFIFLTIFSSNFVFSQEETEKIRLFNVKTTGIYGTTGFHFSDYEGVNKMLSDSGHLIFDKMQTNWGFGFTARTSRSVFNLEFTSFTQCNTGPDYFCSHLDFTSYSLVYGFDIAKTNKFDFYPYIGLSRNRTDILLSYVNIPEITFANHLLTNPNIARLTRVNYSILIGAGFDYFIPFSKKYSSQFILGIYGGYYLQLNESTWYLHVDENPVTMPPKTNAGGAFLKFKIGFCF